MAPSHHLYTHAAGGKINLEFGIEEVGCDLKYLIFVLDR